MYRTLAAYLASQEAYQHSFQLYVLHFKGNNISESLLQMHNLLDSTCILKLIFYECVFKQLSIEHQLLRVISCHVKIFL